MNHREERIPRYKGCPNLYEGDLEEDDEEEVMAALCLIGATYQSIQAKREDETTSS